jgi:DNA polymerase IIIc chi subunit
MKNTTSKATLQADFENCTEHNCIEYKQVTIAENFYKLFPKFVSEVHHSNLGKIIIYCSSKEEMQYIDNMLWTYEQLSFLPHATEYDAHAEIQPILIMSSVTFNNPNISSIAIVILPEEEYVAKKVLQSMKLYQDQVDYTFKKVVFVRKTNV